MKSDIVRPDPLIILKKKEYNAYYSHSNMDKRP